MPAAKKTPTKPAANKSKAEPAFSGLPGETTEITTTRDPLAALKGWKFGNAEVVLKLDAKKNVATVAHISFMGDHSLAIAELANPIHDFDLKVDAEAGALKGLPTILFVAAIDGTTITPSKVFVYHDDDVDDQARRTLRRAVFNDPKAIMTIGTEIDLTPPKKAPAPKKDADGSGDEKKTPVKKAPAKKPAATKAPAVKKAPNEGPAKKPAPRKAPARKAGPAKATAAKAPAAKPKPTRRATPKKATAS